MTDSDVVLDGPGFVNWGIDDEGNSVESQHARIMVFASGLLLFSTGAGETVAAIGPRVRMPKPNWSLLDLPRTPPAAPPHCARCEDDPTTIARMRPPVCPGCGRTA